MTKNMLQEYIVNLILKSEVSEEELALRIGIQPLHLSNLKYGSIQSPSLNLIEKVAAYLDQDPVFVVYDIFFRNDERSLLETHSKLSLLLLCKLYLNNYSISIDKTSTHCFFENAPIKFEGYAYQKRYTAKSIVIDSWETLVKEHEDKLSKTSNQKDNKGFKDRLSYIHDVYITALSKFNNSNDEIRKYVIIINDLEVFEAINKYKIKGKLNSNIIPLYIQTAEMLVNEIDVSQL